MKKYFLILLLVLSACSTTPKASSIDTAVDSSQVAVEQKSEYAKHPPLQKPFYLDENNYEVYKKAVKPPPNMTSKEQKNDETVVLDLQKKRTQAECERAASEVKITLQSFYAKPYGPLSDDELKELHGFFEQVRNDTAFFVVKLKKEYPRQRPFVYMQGIEPCIQKEATQAYPSGHSTLGHLYALILSDIFPQKRAALLARGQQIAEDRVLGGVHHPSDIASGKELAKVFYKQFKKSENFKKRISEFKKAVNH